jgi:hypothetical protein
LGKQCKFLPKIWSFLPDEKEPDVYKLFETGVY